MKKLNRVNNLLINITASVMSINIKLRAKHDSITPTTESGVEPRVYIQAIYESPCSKTGEMMEWKGRKHYLSEHMTDDEVVKTAYVAVKMAVEHEVMEGFKFAGVTIFNPHVPYNVLMEVSNEEVTREDLR